MDRTVPYINTSLSYDELAVKLKELAPWRHEIIFSNGLKTSEFGKGAPWTAHPWAKLVKASEYVPFHELSGGRALDVGCNSGHNSLFLAQNYKMSGLGIDVVERHIETSKLLLQLIDPKGWKFTLQDANRFKFDEPFDVVLHLGTLYHLEHPMLSLESCSNALRNGGWLILETQCYGDGNLCYYFARGSHSDPSNWWALGPEAVTDMLEVNNFTAIQEISNWTNEERIGKNMSRRIFIAKKASTN